MVFKVSSSGVNDKIGQCLGMCGEQGDLGFEVMREMGGRNSNRWGSVFKSVKLRGQPGVAELSWVTHRMRLTKFANGDVKSRIKFRFLNEEDREVGHCITTCEDMVSKPSHQFKLLKGSGTMMIEFTMTEVPGFIDYLKDGWQISFAVAIDFTGSNGDPKSPSSLHYMGPNNQYF